VFSKTPTVQRIGLPLGQPLGGIGEFSVLPIAITEAISASWALAEQQRGSASEFIL